MAESDDIPHRVRNLEESRARHGEDIAGLKSDVKNQGDLVRAVAPLVGDLATVRGVANDAKASVESLREDFDEERKAAVKDREDRRRFNLTLAISLAGTFVAFAGLVFVILTFAGAN